MFYIDILSYDEEDAQEFTSKEVYMKKVSTFFNTIPGQCTAAELIRAVYESSSDRELPEIKRNPAITLGYVSPNGKMVMFGGDQENVNVKLTDRDKLIVFGAH